MFLKQWVFTQDRGQQNVAFRFLTRTIIAALLWSASGLLPAQAQDAAEIVVRVGRLENQIRQMAGDIEQLRHENRLLSKELEKLNPGNVAAATATTRSPAAINAPPVTNVYEEQESSEKTGAPRPLGQTLPSRPLSPDEMEPEGTQNKRSTDILGGDDTEEPLLQVHPMSDNGSPSSEPENFENNPQAAIQEYEIAQDYLQSGYYEKAEMQYKSFLHSYPQDKLAPQAIYGLGQSFAKRERHREAGEQFVRIAEEYPNSEPAPDAMIKLGISLNALGAPDKACALFAEVKKRYPKASQMVLKAAERERKRAKCGS